MSRPSAVLPSINGSIMKNPFQIQEGATTETPLFLIHDGGGTIFQYCLLHDLDRDVWGIYNPYFSDAENRIRDLHDMAKIYTMMIKRVMPYGDIIVGDTLSIGWSLGGCIALQVAHLLQDDDDLHIKGIIMIDSIYPIFRPDSSETESYFSRFLDTVPEDIRVNVQRCINQAMYMLSRWRGPEWSRRETDSHPTSNTFHETTGPPPIILIRAIEEMPAGWGTLDAGPRDTFLGWDKYIENPFRRILGVPGHHFSIFEEQNISDVTKAIKEGCEFLEKMVV